MLAGFGRGGGYRGQHIVRGGYYDNVDIGTGDGGLPVCDRRRAGYYPCHCFGSLADGVATDCESAAGQRLGPLPADQAAADDCCAHS